MEEQIKNARITAVRISLDRGIFLCPRIYLEGAGWGVSFGGLICNKRGSDPTPLLGFFMMRVLETLDLEAWEDLPGKLIRTKSEGIGGRCLEIGHPIENKWFAISELKELANETLRQSDTEC